MRTLRLALAFMRAAVTQNPVLYWLGASRPWNGTPAVNIDLYEGYIRVLFRVRCRTQIMLTLGLAIALMYASVTPKPVLYTCINFFYALVRGTPPQNRDPHFLYTHV